MKFQHGDVLIKSFDGKLEGRVLKTNILVQSDTTFHKHQLQGGKYTLRQKTADEFFLNVTSKTTIVHEEHKPIDIPIGKYKITFVREYDYFLEEARRVID
jgi:uncharacterized protein (DUF1499 family)